MGVINCVSWEVGPIANRQRSEDFFGGNGYKGDII